MPETYVADFRTLPNILLVLTKFKLVLTTKIVSRSLLLMIFMIQRISKWKLDALLYRWLLLQKAFVPKSS